MGFKRSKGISPFIGSVLLVAFTISISGMAAPWLTEITNDLMEGTSDYSETVVSAAESRLDITNVNYDEEEETVRGGFQNTGSTELENFTVTVQGDSSEQVRVTESLSTNQITVFTVEDVESPETVTVQSEQVPVSSEYRLD